VVAWLLPRPEAGNTSWSLEASDRDLFDGVGLRQSGVRGAIRRSGWRLELEAAQLAADVGSERRAAVYLGRDSPSWLIVAGMVYQTVTIGSVTPAVELTAVDLRAGAFVTERVRVRCDVEGFRIAGLDVPGADVATSVTVLAAGGLGVGASLELDRSLGARACVSAALCLAGCVVVVAGYDEDSGALSLAIAAATSSVRGAAGASVHPVLGVSRGASVGWVH
jgi:hypothetical protein